MRVRHGNGPLARSIVIPSTCKVIPHPRALDYPSVDGLIIMALADMSHGVKKIANSVERGNLLGLNYMPINILMLKDCYMVCPDMKQMVSS